MIVCMTTPMTISGRISNRTVADVASARHVATHVGEANHYVNVLVNVNVNVNVPGTKTH